MTTHHHTTEAPMASKLTGHAAIEYAERTGATLHKYQDPTEGARDGLSVDDAREVAAEDPSLIWAEATIDYRYTTYTSITGDRHLAILVDLDDVAELLGHALGETDPAADDERIVEALLASGAPEWVRGAEGWIEPTLGGQPAAWGVYDPEGMPETVTIVDASGEEIELTATAEGDHWSVAPAPDSTYYRQYQDPWYQVQNLADLADQVGRDGHELVDAEDLLGEAEEPGTPSGH